MNLKIRTILDPGVANQERIIIDALDAVDIGRFALSTVKTGPESSVYPENAFFYWLPDTQVKRGDLVVVYTKPGSRSQTANADGSTTYFFYWGQTRTLFNEAEITAVLLAVPEWKVYKRAAVAA